MKRTHLKHRTPLKLVVFAFLVISLIIAFSVSFKLYLDAAFVDLRKFDWNGVAGISNALIVVINLFLSVGIFLSYTSIQESTKARTLETLQIAAEYIDAIQVDMELLRNHHAGDIGNLEDKISIQRAASKIPVGPAQNISKTMQRCLISSRKK